MATHLEQSPEGLQIARIELVDFDFDSNFTLAGICKTILASGPVFAERFLNEGFFSHYNFAAIGASRPETGDDCRYLLSLHPDGNTRSAIRYLTVLDNEVTQGTRVIAAQLFEYYNESKEKESIFGILRSLGVKISDLDPSITDGDYDGYQFSWATLIQERLDGRHTLSLAPHHCDQLLEIGDTPYWDWNQPFTVDGMEPLPYEEIIHKYYGVQHLLGTVGLAHS
jgi:hypothetical protein